MKAQVQIGGRGKGGGHLPRPVAPRRPSGPRRRILSEGFRGTPVTRVLVERLVDIDGEFYCAITLDRTTGRYLAMVSSSGGMDIEEIARTEPEAIRRAQIDPTLGLKDVPDQIPGGAPARSRPGPGRGEHPGQDVRRRGRGGRHAGRDQPPRADRRTGWWSPSTPRSPSTTTRSYRQPAWPPSGPTFPVDPTQARANEKGLQYVKLDGEVGIIGNGAGLVMATLDVVTPGGRAARRTSWTSAAGRARRSWRRRSRWCCPTRRCARCW